MATNSRSKPVTDDMEREDLKPRHATDIPDARLGRSPVYEKLDLKEANSIRS